MRTSSLLLRAMLRLKVAVMREMRSGPNIMHNVVEKRPKCVEGT